MLEQYLETPPIAGSNDPISYWKVLLDRPNQRGVLVRTQQGQLARMAIDYLTVPGKSCRRSRHSADSDYAPATSVDIERLFSHAGLTVTPRRESLGEETTREIVSVGRWFSDGLVPTEKLIDSFNNKQSRKGKGKKGADKSTPIEVDDD